MRSGGRSSMMSCAVLAHLEHAEQQRRAGLIPCRPHSILVLCEHPTHRTEVTRTRAQLLWTQVQTHVESSLMSERRAPSALCACRTLRARPFSGRRPVSRNRNGAPTIPESGRPCTVHLVGWQGCEGFRRPRLLPFERGLRHRQKDTPQRRLCPSIVLRPGEQPTPTRLLHNALLV